MERIQVLLHPEEKEKFRRLALQRGLSLSAWLREAALEREAEEGGQARLRSSESLRAFFAECDARELGREPEWEEHLAVLGASKRAGAGELPSASGGGGGSSAGVGGGAAGRTVGAERDGGAGGEGSSSRAGRRATSRKRR